MIIQPNMKNYKQPNKRKPHLEPCENIEKTFRKKSPKKYNDTKQNGVV
jgi:hypothetical protein